MHSYKHSLISILTIQIPCVALPLLILFFKWRTTFSIILNKSVAFHNTGVALLEIFMYVKTEPQIFCAHNWMELGCRCGFLQKDLPWKICTSKSYTLGDLTSLHPQHPGHCQGFNVPSPTRWWRCTHMWLHRNGMATNFQNPLQQDTLCWGPLSNSTPSVCRGGVWSLENSCSLPEVTQPA